MTDMRLGIFEILARVISLCSAHGCHVASVNPRLRGVEVDEADER